MMMLLAPDIAHNNAHNRAELSSSCASTGSPSRAHGQKAPARLARTLSAALSACSLNPTQI